MKKLENLFLYLKNFNDTNNNENRIKIYIDVGVKNLFLYIEDYSLCFLINFKTFDYFKKKLFIFLKDFFNSLNINSFFLIKIENQIKKNIKVQYFLEGVISSILNKFTLTQINANMKKKIAKNKFNWNYEKIKSKKKFINLTISNQELKQFLLDEKNTYFLINIDENSYSQSKDIFKTFKKFDDYIDTKLFSLL